MILRDSLLRTCRLNIFKIDLVPDSEQGHQVRHYWFAVRHDLDLPFPIAHLTIWDHPATRATMGGPWIEWLEVSTEHRRQGIATEFRRAVETLYYRVPLASSAATEAGERFLESLDREVQRG